MKGLHIGVVLGWIVSSLAFGSTALAAPLLDGAALRFVDVEANDIAADRTRGVVYATVPGAAGLPNGNSIVTIDPSTGAIVDSSFAGSEPRKIEVSDDGSRVYVGIDGARSFRSWRPATDTYGPLLPLVSSFNDSSVAQNLAIAPGVPEVVVVARDEVGSSASGDLETYRNDVAFAEGPSFPDADEIAFVDATTLAAYNSSSTGFDLVVYDLDPTDLTLTDIGSTRGLISGFSTDIEVADGLIYASSGIVVDPATLGARGTYTTGLSGAAVEAIPEAGLTYFLGSRGFNGETELLVFDLERFILLDSLGLGESLGTIDSLERVGQQLAFRTTDGEVGLISGVPVPEPSTAFLVWLGLCGLARRPRAS